MALFIAFFLMILANQATEATNSSSSKRVTKTEFLQGAISENELIDSLEKLGIKCVIHEGEGSSTLGSLHVEQVRLGSSAYYGGILAGDIIKNLHKLSADTFSLSIERAGKLYQVNLNSLSENLDADQIRLSKEHLQSGLEYARALLYGHASNLNTEIEQTELARQMASISALKSSTLLRAKETEDVLQGSASALGLSSGIRRFDAHIEMINPYKASFLNINLCMAPPTDPYGKLQWNALIAERDKSSALSSAWDNWERNLGDYICRRWALTECSGSGVVVYHVILKNNGKMGEIKLMPVAELSSFAGGPDLADCGRAMIKKLDGSAILFFPRLTQVTEVHLEIGLINKG